MTPHQILGLPTTATVEEIKATYRTLSKKCHPDVCKDPDSARKFRELTDAKDMAIARAKLFNEARGQVQYSWAQTGTDSIFGFSVKVTVTQTG